MNLIKNTLIEYTRKPIKTIILCIIFVSVIFAALIGICLNDIAKQGEKDAFIYHGASVFIESESKDLTLQDYSSINNVEHVLGTFVFNSSIALPVGGKNVKEHTGADITNTNTSSTLKDSVGLLSLMDVEHYSWFQREKSVSLIEGEFPNNENKGALIESRYANENNLNIGDKVSFKIQDSEKICEFKVCGIYEINSDFYIYESEDTTEDIYVYSPYNNIFLDYESALEQMEFEPNYQYGCGIYVDYAENIEAVAADLKEIFGENANVYMETTKNFSEIFGVISIMQNYSHTILIGICGIIGIILLIILTFFANQYSYECGIYLALGEKKYRIVLRHVLYNLILMIVSFVIAIIIYCFTADFIAGTMNNTAVSTMEQAQNISVMGPYVTPNLEQGFSLQINTKGVYSIKTAIIIMGYMFGGLLLSLSIPLYEIYITKPRNVLNSK